MPCSRFFVYILASSSRVTYVGVTRDLTRRLHEHRSGFVEGFTRRHEIKELVYFEETPSARAAFAREKQIKGWTRRKKIDLIEGANAEWTDLAEKWFSE